MREEGELGVRGKVGVSEYLNLVPGDCGDGQGGGWECHLCGGLGWEVVSWVYAGRVV